MGNLFSDAPGIAEASRAFRQEQLEAFIGIEPSLCGVEVNPFTPRMAMELELAGNVFLCGGMATGLDVLQFAHRISKGFQPGDRKQIRVLAKRLYDKRAQEGVEEYIKRAHAARPAFQKDIKGNQTPSDSCWMSLIVDALCGWYPHITIQGALDLPYRIMWQLWQRRMEEIIKDYKQTGAHAMEARQKFLDEQTAKNAEDFRLSQLKKGIHGVRS